MPTDRPNPLEGLYRAVIVLASAQGRIQERLAESFWQHLCQINPAMLPPSVREDFAVLCTELKSLLGGSREHTADIDETKAGEYARRVILVYDAVLRSLS